MNRRSGVNDWTITTTDILYILWSYRMSYHTYGLSSRPTIRGPGLGTVRGRRSFSHEKIFSRTAGPRDHLHNSNLQAMGWKTRCLRGKTGFFSAYITVLFSGGNRRARSVLLRRLDKKFIRKTIDKEFYPKVFATIESEQGESQCIFLVSV